MQDQQEDVELKLRVDIYSKGDGHYRVKLQVIAKKQDSYSVKVAISGFCSVDNTLPYSKELIKKNTVAILFPYVRSELTLITAQPGIEPLVLPAINVNGLIDQLSHSDNESEK